MVISSKEGNLKYRGKYYKTGIKGLKIICFIYKSSTTY